VKKVQFYFGLLWRPVLVVSLLGLLLIGALFFQLNDHVAYSNAEAAQHSQSKSLKLILNSPINLPKDTPELIAQKLAGSHIVWTRRVSVMFGIISVVGFFFVARSWHTRRIAVMATIMYATSTWFLITARLGSADILLTLLPALFMIRIWLGITAKRKLALLCSTLLAASFLYIPGGVWFLLFGIVWRNKKFLKEVRTVPFWYFITCIFAFLICLIPLMFGVIHDYNAIRSVLGIASLPTITGYAHTVKDVILSLFWRADRTPYLTLGKSALLDGFSIITLLLGVYAYGKRYKLDRSKLLFAGSLLSLLLIGFGGPVYIAILLPFVYLFIAAGLAWLLQQWFTVFPKNPLARNVGLGIVIVTVGLSVFYNVFRYYVAWPHIPQTKQVYNLKP
jgi:hypothetical protein